MPREKLRSIRREIFSAFEKNDRHLLTIQHLTSLLGKLNALRGAVISAQLHLWPFHHLMKDALDRCRGRWVDTVSRDQPVKEEMLWWVNEMKDWSGKSIIPVRSQMVVTTDASSHGWVHGGGSSATPAHSATKPAASGSGRSKACRAMQESSLEFS